MISAPFAGAAAIVGYFPIAAAGYSDSSTAVPTTGGFSYFFRGFFFGAIFLLAAQVFVIHRLLVHFLADPSKKRLLAPSEGDRPSFARDFVGVTSRDGSRDADHEILKDELIGEKTKYSASSAHKTSREHHEPWPENIVEFLKKALTPNEDEDTFLSAATPPVNGSAKGDAASGDVPIAVGPTEQCHWINVLVQRFYLALRGSELFKTKAKAKWTEKINAKLKGNAFLSRVEITDISLGDHPPKIFGVRLLKGMSDDLAVSAEIDLTYNGGGSIAIQATLVRGLKLPVRVYVSSLAGRLRVRCPSIRWPDMIGVAFVEDPGASFRVDSPITVGDNELLRGMVNKLLSSVVRKVFLELWVLPSWRTFFMPLMEPKLEDILARQQQASAPKDAIAAKKILASKAATLWETRSPLLRHTNKGGGTNLVLTGDALGPLSFSTDTVLDPSSSTIEEMEDKLVRGFLAYAKDLPNQILDGAVKPDDASDTTSITSESEGGTPAATPGTATPWKSTRNRNNIIIEKKRVLVQDEQVAELTRATMTIRCDAERVYSVLSNPEHHRHADETYSGSEIVHQFDDARGVLTSTYRLNKATQKVFTTFNVKRVLSPKRSASGSSLAIPAEDVETASIVTTQSRASESTARTTDSVDRPVEFIVVSRSIRSFNETAQQTATQESTLVPGHNESSGGKSSNPGSNWQGLAGFAVQAAAENNSSSSPSQSPPLPQRGPTPASTSSNATQAAVNPIPNDTNDPPSGKIYVYGYLITTDPTTNGSDTCRVTVLSQLSSDLAKLEISYDACRKLKTFIEELASLSGYGTDPSKDRNKDGLSNRKASGNLRRRRFFSDNASEKSNSMSSTFATVSSASLATLASASAGSTTSEKIKNIVGSTAGYLIRSRRVAGWLNKGSGRGEGAASGGEQTPTTPSVQSPDMDSPAISERISSLADDADFEGESMPLGRLPRRRSSSESMVGRSSEVDPLPVPINRSRASTMSYSSANTPDDLIAESLESRGSIASYASTGTSLHLPPASFEDEVSLRGSIHNSSQPDLTSSADDGPLTDVDEDRDEDDDNASHQGIFQADFGAAASSGVASSPPSLPPRLPSRPLAASLESPGNADLASLSGPSKSVHDSEKVVTIGPRTLSFVQIDCFREEHPPDARLAFTWDYFVVDASQHQQHNSQAAYGSNTTVLFSLYFIPIPESDETNETKADTPSHAAERILLRCLPKASNIPAGLMNSIDTMSTEELSTARYIIPPVTTHTRFNQKAAAEILVSYLPSGRFLLVFDNTGERRMTKAAYYNAAIRVVSDKPKDEGRPDSGGFRTPPPMLGGESEFALHQSPSLSALSRSLNAHIPVTPIRTTLDVAVPRKQRVRLPVLVDATVDQPVDLYWEFLVAAGSEVGFEVHFEEIVGGQGDRDSHETEEDGPPMLPLVRADIDPQMSSLLNLIAGEKAEESSSAPLDVSKDPTSNTTTQEAADLLVAASAVTEAILAGPDSAVFGRSATPPATTPRDSQSQSPGMSRQSSRLSLSARLAAAVQARQSQTLTHSPHVVDNSTTTTTTASGSSSRSAPVPFTRTLTLVRDASSASTSSSTTLAHDASQQPPSNARGGPRCSAGKASRRINSRGVVTFVWDNSHAVVAGRRVSFTVWTEPVVK